MTAHVIWTLSTLPSATSALQSSISALERDITALESRSSGLEPWLGWFTLLVAIGVTLEIFVVIHDHGKEVNEWRVSELIPEGPSLKKLGIQIASIILVIAGVMGEFGVGLKISSINGQLRAKGAELRSKSDQLLALVTEEAGTAQASAEGAADAAARANISARHANDQAKIAKERAEKIAEEAARIGWYLSFASRQLDWRQLDVKDFVALLKGKPKGTAEIWYVPDDEEASRFASAIANALGKEGAGWDVSGVGPLPVLRDSDLKWSKTQPLLTELRLMASDGLSIAGQECVLTDLTTACGAFWNALSRSISTKTFVIQGENVPSLPRNHVVVVVGHHWTRVRVFKMGEPKQ